MSHPKRTKGKIIEWDSPLYRGINDKYDQERELPANGFYGYGAYFVTEKEGASIWGTVEVEYKVLRPLQILVHSGRVVRGDYMSSLPEECDGVWFQHEAEGGEQLILRNFRSVKKIKATGKPKIKHW